MKSVFPASSWPISMEITPEMVRIESEHPLSVLSSAIYGGGQMEATAIINRYVSKQYSADDPEAEVRNWLRHQGIPLDSTVVLLTAAYVHLAQVKVVETQWFRLAAIVTAGVSNAARAGNAYPVFMDTPSEPGTINTILLVDGHMTEGAQVNAIIMATEAKAAALQDAKVKDGQGRIATGTTTDAIVVASTQEKLGGYAHRYAGITSPLGHAISQTVYQAVKEAVCADPKGLGKGMKG